MSTLISSAVGGKRTAPKAAPRRRAPPPPPPPPPSKAPPKGRSPSPSRAPAAEPALNHEAPPSPQPTQLARLDLQSPAAPVYEPPAPSPPVAQQELAPAPSPAAADLPVPVEKVLEAVGRPVEQEARTPAPVTRAGKRKRDAALASEPSQPARSTKHAKRNSARSNAQAQANVNEGETPAASVPEPVIDPELRQDGEVSQLGSAAPGVVKRTATKRRAPSARKGKRKAAATRQGAEDGVPTDEQSEDAPRLRTAAPKKKARKRKHKTDSAPAAEDEGDSERTQQEGERQQGEAEEDDESDPELHEIDPNTLTMVDLARAQKRGKTSEREKKMAEINWDEVIQKRREEEEQAMQDALLQEQQRLADRSVRPTTERRNGTAGQASTEQEPPAEAEQPAQPDVEGGLRFKVVNGQIVEDESTLTIGNQAQAQAEADAAATEAVEENDLTVRINNATYLNSRRRDAVERQVPAYRNKSDPWSEEETERFYGALKMFGTDFLIISKMFPGKTRQMVKKKFVREERLDLVRINNALLGRDTNPTPMNLDYYAKETGRELSDFQKYATHEEAMASLKSEYKEMEEDARKKIAEAAEDRRQQDIAEKEREAGKKKRGGKKKGEGMGKKKGGAGLGGGGPVESGARAEPSVEG